MKNRFIKSIKILTSLVFVLSFIWIMVRVDNPISISRLRSKYDVCDMMDITSWQTPQEYPNKISSNLNPQTQEKYIEATYNHIINRALLECRGKIPVEVLYKAHTINFVIKLSELAILGPTIKRAGQGPELGPVKITSENIGKSIIITKQLDEASTPRLTWLSGDYDTVSFDIRPLDPNKPLTLTIYE